jgi:hypothetical protein
MARQIVLQHGGIMWADPLPAGGTRVSFVIPAHVGQTLTAPPLLSEVESVTEPERVATEQTAEAEPGGTVLPFTQRTGTGTSS